MSDLATFSIAIISSVVGGVVIFLLIKNSSTDKDQSDAIRDLERRVTDLMRDIRGSVDGGSKQMNRQIESFTRETTQMRSELKRVQEGIDEVSSFQELFKSPKLRGEWGEASLGHLLSQYYPKELYATQYLFSSGRQVDAVLKLPNEKVLPIDAKFSTENFSRMIEDESYRKSFVDDLKKQVDEIAERYILPQEGTVEFAIMYVPAEAIYYDIVHNIGKEFDLHTYAMKKKVVVASPNTLFLTLKTVEHWFRDSQLSKNTQMVIKRLERVRKDAEILEDDFRKLGGHLGKANSAFERSQKKVTHLQKRADMIIKGKQELLE